MALSALLLPLLLFGSAWASDPGTAPGAEPGGVPGADMGGGTGGTPAGGTDGAGSHAAPSHLGTPPPPPEAYAIGAGDTLAVQVYGEAGLSGTFPVDDAGNLDFPLLGAVPVAGMPAGAVAELLESRLSPRYLAHPSVTVWISAWHSQPVQVLGAVARPGTYFLRGRTTVLQMLSEVGGVSGTGVNEVRITRGDGAQVYVIPYDQLLTRGWEELALVAGDIVYVPQSLVSVLGEVGKPGEVAWRDGITLSQTIASVGGALPTADLARIYILRGDHRIRVSLRRILRGRDADVPLQPGDRIVVGESAV